MTVTCKVCGEVMNPDHGIVHMSGIVGGVTWWQCICGRRVKEDYRIENDKIISVSSVEV